MKAQGGLPCCGRWCSPRRIFEGWRRQGLAACGEVVDDAVKGMRDMVRGRHQRPSARAAGGPAGCHGAVIGLQFRNNRLPSSLFSKRGTLSAKPAKE